MLHLTGEFEELGAVKWTSRETLQESLTFEVQQAGYTYQANKTFVEMGFMEQDLAKVLNNLSETGLFFLPAFCYMQKCMSVVLDAMEVQCANKD